MTSTYEEKEALIPRTAFIALAFILIASDAFLLICCLFDISSWWMFAVTTIVFIPIIVFAYLLKMKIRADGNVLTLSLLKTYRIPYTDIIDVKIGDIDIIRNYSGWGIKKVKFKNLICPGFERGVSFKVAGRRVFTVSTTDPDALVAATGQKE